MGYDTPSRMSFLSNSCYWVDTKCLHCRCVREIIKFLCIANSTHLFSTLHLETLSLMKRVNCLSNLSSLHYLSFCVFLRRSPPLVLGVTCAVRDICGFISHWTIRYHRRLNCRSFFFFLTAKILAQQFFTAKVELGPSLPLSHILRITARNRCRCSQMCHLLYVGSPWFFSLYTFQISLHVSWAGRTCYWMHHSRNGGSRMAKVVLREYSATTIWNY